VGQFYLFTIHLSALDEKYLMKFLIATFVKFILKISF
jgi:hypothetical protein